MFVDYLRTEGGVLGSRAEELRAEMQAGLQYIAAAQPPTPIGERWLRHVVDPVDGSSEIRIGTTVAAVDTVLLRSTDLPGPKPSIEWVVPSPTGAHAAVALATCGDEDATIRILDLTTGELLADAVPHSFVSPVSWSTDGSGFYATVSSGPFAAAAGPQATVLHRLGGATEQVPEASGDNRRVVVEPSGDALVVEGPGSITVPSVIRRAGHDVWQLFLADMGPNVIGTTHGDWYVAVVHDADRGRVVAIPLSSPRDRASWIELVPAGRGVLRGVTPLAAHLVTFEIIDGEHRIGVHRWRPDEPVPAEPDHLVELPPRSGLDLVFGFGQANGEPRVLPDGETTVTFHLGGFDRPPCLMRYDVTTRTIEPVDEPPTSDDRIVATSHQAVSIDGEPVTYWQVRLRSTVGPSHSIVVGYGGFNIAQHTPCHPTPLMPWLERGGCLLLPHLRGGGEHGLAHWRAATGMGKQRTFDDLFAVVEHAVAMGIADPAAVGFVGASNGGLTAAAAVTQRPELFRAVVCGIPLVDLAGLHRLAIGRLFEEYGAPDDPAEAAARARISPLQQVRDGVRYPAVLVDIGSHDARCPAAPAREFARRLQAAATPGGRQVVLRERLYGGHVTVEGDVWPVWLDFLIAELIDAEVLT
jgi:prolyl oligopeptidase